MTYCDHLDFPLTSWSDLTEWPLLDSLASQGASIIGVNMERRVEPGDTTTREAFENFKNKFVQQNCHRDVEIRQVYLLFSIIIKQSDPLFICTEIMTNNTQCKP